MRSGTRATVSAVSEHFLCSNSHSSTLVPGGGKAQIWEEKVRERERKRERGRERERERERERDRMCVCVCGFTTVINKMPHQKHTNVCQWHDLLRTCQELVKFIHFALKLLPLQLVLQERLQKRFAHSIDYFCFVQKEGCKKKMTIERKADTIKKKKE